MARKTKRKFKIGSLITGFGLGSLIGWYISGFISGDMPIFESHFLVVSVLSFLMGSLFAYFAYKRPVFIEYLAYATSIYILFQYAWDFRVGDRGPERLYMAIHGVILLLINIVSGRVKLIGATSTAKNAVGLGGR